MEFTEWDTFYPFTRFALYPGSAPLTSIPTLVTLGHYHPFTFRSDPVGELKGEWIKILLDEYYMVIILRMVNIV